MAEQYRVDVIADIQKYVKPLSDLPGVTKANAEKAAIALATSLGKVEGAAAEATAKVQAFNKSLIEQGVSEKAAAAASLSYAKSLAQAGATTERAAVNTATFADAAGETAQRAGNLGAAFTAVAQQGQDMAVQLAMGTDTLMVMGQQLPQLVGQLSMAGFGFSSLAAAAGPVAIVLAGVAAAYSVVGNATFDAERAQLEYAASAEGTEEAARRLADALRAVEAAQRETATAFTDSGMEIAQITGALADYEVEAGKAAQQVRDGAQAEVTARQESNAMLMRRLDLVRRAIAADETDSAQKPALIAQERELTAQYESGVRALRGLLDARETQAQALSSAIVQAGQEKEAQEASEASRRAHEKAMRAQEEALRALSAAMQAENDEAERSQKTYQGAIDAINGIERAQKQATASEAERINMAYAATLDTIAAEERKALAVSNSVAATETIQQEGERAREAARAAHLDALRSLDEKRTEDARKAAEEQQRIEEAAGNARIQLASTLAGAIGTIAQTAGQNLTDEQKQAAEVLYAIQKASALAVIALNTILAVSQASTSAPAPYNAIPMAIAGAQGAAQFAAAAASPPPKFHSGTLSAGPGPGAARRGNEFTAVLEGGEAIIPRATMQQPGAKEQAAALVSGRSPVAADEVAKGMDRSSLPYYLEQLVRLARKPAQRTRNSRPGHKPRYGAA